MAEVQESFPIVGQPFTDAQWRTIIGQEAGIVGDTDGTAYTISLPASSDVAEVGSASEDSAAVVGGFGHRIPAGLTQSIEIPPSTNATNGRGDVIALSYDPTNVGAPVNLVRIPGVEGSTTLPPLDEGPPGAEVLALWEVRRRAGQGLNQATVRDMRTWASPHLYVAPDRGLSPDVPLGTVARRGSGPSRFVRVLQGTTPAWIQEGATPDLTVNGWQSLGTSISGWAPSDSCKGVAWGLMRDLTLQIRRPGSSVAVDGASSFGFVHVFSLAAGWRPPTERTVPFHYLDNGNTRGGIARIGTAGDVRLLSGEPGSRITSSETWSIRMALTWLQP